MSSCISLGTPWEWNSVRLGRPYRVSGRGNQTRCVCLTKGAGRSQSYHFNTGCFNVMASECSTHSKFVPASPKCVDIRHVYHSKCSRHAFSDICCACRELKKGGCEWKVQAELQRRQYIEMTKECDKSMPVFEKQPFCHEGLNSQHPVCTKHKRMSICCKCAKVPHRCTERKPVRKRRNCEDWTEHYSCERASGSRCCFCDSYQAGCELVDGSTELRHDHLCVDHDSCPPRKNCLSVMEHRRCKLNYTDTCCVCLREKEKVELFSPANHKCRVRLFTLFCDGPGIRHAKCCLNNTGTCCLCRSLELQKCGDVEMNPGPVHSFSFKDKGLKSCRVSRGKEYVVLEKCVSRRSKDVELIVVSKLDEIKLKPVEVEFRYFSRKKALVLKVKLVEGLVLMEATVRRGKDIVPYTAMIPNADNLIDLIPPMFKFSDPWLSVTLTECSRLAFKQGQVQSHQTGNKENIAGGNITTINYYGTEYAQAYNPASQTMDPSKFTDPMVQMTSNLTGVPALQSPSAERCGYSDRLMQLTAGNSCIMTQESAAGAIIAYGRFPTYTDNSDASVDLPTRPGVSCDRWYTLPSTNWAKTGFLTIDQSIGQTNQYYDNFYIPLPGALNLGVFGQNMQYHYLWRGGFAVHVQCNATKFHQGCLMVAAIPECQLESTDVDIRTEINNRMYGVFTMANEPVGWTVEQMPLAPHQLINIRSNNSATLILPYINVTPASYPRCHNIWTIWIRIIEPLDYSAGASTNVPITVSVCPIASQFSGLRNQVPTVQGLPTFSIPGSGQFCTTVRNAGIPAYASFEKTHSFENPGRVRNLLEVAQVATFAFLGEGMGATVSNVANSQADFPDEVFSIDLSLLATQLETTYVGRLARMFQCYRGSLNFTFFYTGAALATGKLLIAYTPPGGSKPRDRGIAMQGTHIVWDIGLQSSITFTVPFISVSQYRLQVDRTVLGYDGYVTCHYQTSIVVPPDCPSTSKIYCMVSACDDMVFRTPIDTTYYQGPTDPPPPIEPAILNYIHQAIGQAMPTHAPGTSSGQITEPQQGNAIQFYETEAPAATAVETGVTVTSAGQTQLALRDSHTSFSRNHTDIEEFFGRYAEIWNLDLGHTDSLRAVELDLGNIFSSRLWVTKFRMFTYWRFDMDFTFVAVEGTTQAVGNVDKAELVDPVVAVMFSPLGSIEPTQTSSTWQSGNNPMVIWRTRGPVATLRIPFCSPANYYSSAFNGFGTFSFNNADYYGKNVGNNIGKLVFRYLPRYANGGNNYKAPFLKIHVFMRPVNIEAYIPRPIVSNKAGNFVIHKRSGRFVVVEDDSMEGSPDTEVVSRQGPPTFTSMTTGETVQLDWPVRTPSVTERLKTGISSLFTTAGEGMAQGFLNTMNAVQDISDGTKPWVKDVLTWLVKLVSGVVMIVRSHADPVIVSAVSISLGVDILRADPFSYMKDVIMQNLGFKWVKTQGPMDWIRNFNHSANMAKSIAWFIDELMKFVNWVKKQLDKTEKLKSMDVLGMINEWNEYVKNPQSYTKESIGSLCKKILDSYEDVVSTESMPRIIVTEFLSVHRMAKKKLSHSKPRPHEPIGLIIHGNSGSGKSLITSIIGKALSMELKTSDPYSLPPDPDHFDDYDSQLVTIMDDLGQNPDGEDFKKLCQMISCTDFNPPMAELDEKGVKFISAFVLASTNLKVLTPPTVCDPSAIDRRFKYKFDIDLNPQYQLKNGKLNIAEALKPCLHNSINTKKCCPLVCGIACKLRDRVTRHTYTVDEVISLLLNEHEDRSKVNDAVEALFQGPTLKKKPSKEMTAELVELATRMGRQEVWDELESMGYILPHRIKRDRLTREHMKWRTALGASVTALGIIAMVGGIIYAACQLWHVNPEGPYNSHCRQSIRPPTRRVVETQGNVSPDLEFANSLMKNNLIILSTAVGDFTALGIGGRSVLVPAHAAVGPYFHNGTELKLMDELELKKRVNGSLRSLELVVLSFENINQFRDVTKFMATETRSVKDALLVMLSPGRMIVPLKNVIPHGVLNLEGEPVSNTLMYSYPTKSGWCGGVIVKAGKIFGMHIGGDGLAGFAAEIKSRYFTVKQGAEIRSIEKSPKPIYMPTQTKLQPSVYFDVFPGEKEPAVLSRRDKRCDCDPFKVALSKYSGSVMPNPVPEMRIASEHYLAQLRQIMGPEILEPLTLTECVEGIEGLDGLDLDTSAGFPYCTQGVTKRQLLKKENGEYSRMAEALDLHGTGLPLVTHFKDELRSKEKVKAGNTRIIECSSLNDTIDMRRTFGRLFAKFHQNPGIVTGSAVGCNPDEHWSQFVNQIGQKHLIQFDYSNFDGSLERIWFMELKFVLIGLGFDEEKVNKLIDGVCFSKHLFGDLVITVDGGMPSGCSGTSIFNSMINNIILRTLVLVTYKGIDLDELKILAYGDDIIASYPFPLESAAIARTGAIFGLKMTPPDKGTEFKEDLDIEECTFLKRGFRQDEKIPFLWHPTMDMKAIYESIRWTKNPAETENHVRSLCEMVWHHGRPIYEDFVDKVRSVPIGRCFRIPPFSYMESKWYDLF